MLGRTFHALGRSAILWPELRTHGPPGGPREQAGRGRLDVELGQIQGKVSLTPQKKRNFFIPGSGIGSEYNKQGQRESEATLDYFSMKRSLGKA